MTKMRKPRLKKGHKPEALTKITKGRQKVRAANKDVPKGEKQMASVTRREVKKRDKQKWQADQKARHTNILTELKPVAKEINARLEKAAGLDGKADDHRLAAALQLEKARQVCKAAKIGFPGWVKANVDRSYDEVKKLVKIAASPEPAKALADMRAGAATRNRQLRERQKKSRDAPAPTAAEVLDTLSDEAALKVMSVKAEQVGMRVVSEADAIQYEDSVTKLKAHETLSKAEHSLTVAEMKEEFLAMKASDKLMFVKWAGDTIGVAVSGDFQEAGDAGGKRPDFLDREQAPKAGTAI